MEFQLLRLRVPLIPMTMRWPDDVRRQPEYGLRPAISDELEISPRAQPDLTHEFGNARDCRIPARSQRSNDVLLLRLGAVLAHLKFCFQPGDGDLKRDDMTQHAALVLFAERIPLLQIR